MRDHNLLSPSWRSIRSTTVITLWKDFISRVTSMDSWTELARFWWDLIMQNPNITKDYESMDINQVEQTATMHLHTTRHTGEDMQHRPPMCSAACIQNMQTQIIVTHASVLILIPASPYEMHLTPHASAAGLIPQQSRLSNWLEGACASTPVHRPPCVHRTSS